MEIVDEAPPVAHRRDRSRRRRRQFLSTAIGLVIVSGLTVGSIWVVNNPQPIIDRVTVWQYEPDDVIAGHAERLQLTDHGRFLYFASTPTVSAGEIFAEQCPFDHDEQDFGVLGCYVHADKVIRLFDVTDTRLDGAEEVVAAHEMLHAAWDRMGRGERGRLTELLDAQYQLLRDDPRFVRRMEFYARYSPGQRANELHSIIGTEVDSIGEELETYYAKYFADRSIVTGLHAASYAVFVQLEEQADALVAELEALRESIEADYASYTNGAEQLTADIEQFNARAQNGYYVNTTQEEFERIRSRLVARGPELDALYRTITERVSHYEMLQTQLAEVNETSAQLQRGLNIGGEARTELAPE